MSCPAKLECGYVLGIVQPQLQTQHSEMLQLWAHQGVCPLWGQGLVAQEAGMAQQGCRAVARAGPPREGDLSPAECAILFSPRGAVLVATTTRTDHMTRSTFYI